jgi:hypothetical protein
MLMGKIENRHQSNTTVTTVAVKMGAKING